MNGYQIPHDGYSSQPPPPHPSQISRNMNTFVAKPHPYNSYYDGSHDFGFSSQRHHQASPMDMTGQYMQQQQQQPQQSMRQSTMNPNAAVFMPRQYEVANVSRNTPQAGFNPYGYGSAQHRPIQQHPPSSQGPVYNNRGGNYLGYQQQASRAPDYATIASHFTPQRIPPPQQQQQLSQHQQQSQPSSQDPLSNLRMSLAEQKQQSEDHLKRQQRDQEEYASRFLAAVQERVQQPRPSSASAAHNFNNGVANCPMTGSSLQNLAASLQDQGVNGGYYEQELSTYDFEAQHNANPPFQLSPDLLERIESLPNKLALFEVQIGLEQLLAEPSEFDAWSVAIRDRLAAKDVTADELDTAAWLVMEMGVNSENAQYNFARICTYLYERLSSFKEPLLTQMQEYHAIRSQLPLETFQNLLVFTAELYVQAFAPVGIRNHPIPTALYEEFSDILKVEPMTDAAMKKISSALKLCGRHLETDIGKEAMDELFTQLRNFSLDEGRPKGLTDTGAGYITNLMIYRNSGWGAGSETSAPRRLAAPENPMDLTEEEIRFLESNGAMEGSSFNSGSTPSSDIYDAEILEDYEKFLRDHAEQTAISAAEKALERLSMEEDDDYFLDEKHRDDNTTPTPSSNHKS